MDQVYGIGKWSDNTWLPWLARSWKAHQPSLFKTMFGIYYKRYRELKSANDILLRTNKVLLAQNRFLVNQLLAIEGRKITNESLSAIYEQLSADFVTMTDLEVEMAKL